MPVRAFALFATVLLSFSFSFVCSFLSLYARDHDGAEMLEGEDGRMIVRDELVVAAEEAAAHDAAVAAAKAGREQGGRRGKRQRRGDPGGKTSGGLEEAMRKRGAKGRGGGAKTGSAYASEKSGGDRQKKGQKLEPFAYIRLSSKYLSKRCVYSWPRVLATVLARCAVMCCLVLFVRRRASAFYFLWTRIVRAHGTHSPFPYFRTSFLQKQEGVRRSLEGRYRESCEKWRNRRHDAARRAEEEPEQAQEVNA